MRTAGGARKWCSETQRQRNLEKKNMKVKKKLVLQWYTFELFETIVLRSSLLCICVCTSLFSLIITPVFIEGILCPPCTALSAAGTCRDKYFWKWYLV